MGRGSFDTCAPVSISAAVEYQAGAMVNPEARQVQPNPLALTPLVSEDLVLENHIVTETHIASGTITAGSNDTITATGNLTFEAGRQIRPRPGFRVQAVGQLRALIDPSLVSQSLAAVCALRHVTEVGSMSVDPSVAPCLPTPGG